MSISKLAAQTAWLAIRVSVKKLLRFAGSNESSLIASFVLLALLGLVTSGVDRSIFTASLLLLMGFDSSNKANRGDVYIMNRVSGSAVEEDSTE